MHPRQSPSGRGGCRGPVRAGFLPRRSNPLQSNDLRPIQGKDKPPFPPKSRRRILSYPLPDFFHPLSPVCRCTHNRTHLILTAAIPTRLRFANMTGVFN